MKTITVSPAELKADNNFLSSLELPELQVYLTWKGGKNVSYVVFKNGGILFQGDDFKPSPLDKIESIDIPICLLSFLTLQPGDTDSEYFEKYTASQMGWANSFECEQLKGLVSDFEDREYKAQATDYFAKYFNL